MENQIIQINLVPNMSTPAVVQVSQYDVGRPLVFKVYDGTSPADLTGVTAVVEGTKRSGLGFSESGTISDNTVTLDTTLAMTQEDGSIPAEIRFSKTGEDVGTANFILSVEKSPHPEGTTDGTHDTMADLQSQLDALDERVDALEGGGGGLTDDIKTALLQIAQKVAYIDAHGQDYYDDLYDALYPPAPPATLVSISAVYTQSGTVYDTDTLDSLKPDLVVTAYYDNQTSAVVTNYTLSGTLTVGTSTVTVNYAGLTTTFTVTVSEIGPPSEYTAHDYLAYIGGTGTRGIITPAQMKSEYTIEFDMLIPTQGGAYGSVSPVFGTRTAASGGTKEIAIFVTGTSGKIGYWYNGTDTTTNITTTKDAVHHFKILPVGSSESYPLNAVIDIDSTEYSTGSTASGVTWSAWFGLMGYGTSASTVASSGSTYYQLGDIVVKDANGDTVYWFMPVSKGTQVGFYDIIGQAFYEADSAVYQTGDWT